MIARIAVKTTRKRHLSISDKLDAMTKSAHAIGVDLISVGRVKSNVAAPEELISHLPQNQNRH